MKTNKSTLMVQLCLALGVVVSSCAPKLNTDWTKEGYTGHSYNKIVVVGISKNLEARNSFEATAVELFKKQGLNAIPGINIFPPNMSEEQRKPENLIKVLKNNQVDGVITMSLIDSEESQRYERGETLTYPGGYYRFGRYYYRTYNTIQTPGYYVPTKSYLIESVLYDVSGELTEDKEAMVWTGQSALVDPTSVESAAKSYTKKLVNHVLAEGVIKTQ
ncbi:MAG: hypothetical protein AAGF85_11740 [Bacteroidota bacterium]